VKSIVSSNIRVWDLDFKGICIGTAKLTFKYVGCTTGRKGLFSKRKFHTKNSICQIVSRKKNATWFRLSITNTSGMRRA
jgi:hypothetical protein